MLVLVQSEDTEEEEEAIELSVSVEESRIRFPAYSNLLS